MKQPLSIYVVWHPEFKDGKHYAEFFYKSFTRDSRKPISRGIGISLFYRYENAHGEKKPLPIPIDETEKTVIIALIDDYMVMDPVFENYLLNYFEDSRDMDNLLVLPVTMSPNAYNIHKKIRNINYIRTKRVKRRRHLNPPCSISVEQGDKTDVEITHHMDHHSLISVKTDKFPSFEFEEQKYHILGSVAHEICRLLIFEKKTKKNQETILSPAPVKMFISHAKADGEEKAIKMRDYLNSSTAIKTFFDAVDIAPGYDFADEIIGNIDRSALLVIQTDAYATREWCRKEIIEAKKARIPIIVVDALEKGEYRSFPYLGNSPTIRWDENRLDEIMCIAILEILRANYQLKFLNYTLNRNKPTLNLRNTIILSNQPELFSFTFIGKRKKKILYPDPPLGTEEIEVLQKIKPFEYITPTSIQ